MPLISDEPHNQQADPIFKEVATAWMLASVPRAEGSKLQVLLIRLIKCRLISDCLPCGLNERSGGFRLTVLDDWNEEAVAGLVWNQKDNRGKKDKIRMDKSQKAWNNGWRSRGEGIKYEGIPFFFFLQLIELSVWSVSVTLTISLCLIVISFTSLLKKNLI